MQEGWTQDAAAVVLADGTPLEGLIDRDERTLSARLLVDPEIFELEQSRIFGRAWIPVAHVSELESPGDFVTRYIGTDPVIVTRDLEGEIHVLLNACSHRGGLVCRAEMGNARRHACPYHGWVFGADGRLEGVPFERMVFDGRLEKPALGLRRARVGVLAGIVFATWDAQAPDLDEYVGDFRWYLEALLCRTDAGLEVSGPPQRFVVDANWKLFVDNFSGDAYHVPTTHKSFLDLGVAPPPEVFLHDFKVSINGHSVLCGDLQHHGVTGAPLELLRQVPPAGMPPELVEQLPRHLRPEQIELLAYTPPSIATLFPSTGFAFIGGQLVEGPIGQVLTMRFWVPLSANRTEFFSFSLVERDAREGFKEAVHRSSSGAFGVIGTFEADDVEIWAGLQRAVRGPVGRRQRLRYPAVGTPQPPDPVRPGMIFRGVSSDDNQWMFYERYFEFLEGRAW